MIKMFDYNRYLLNIDEHISKYVDALVKLNWRDSNFIEKSVELNDKLWFFYGQKGYMEGQKFKDFDDQSILTEYYSLLDVAIEFADENEKIPRSLNEKLCILQNLIEEGIKTNYDREDINE